MFIRLTGLGDQSSSLNEGIRDKTIRQASRRAGLPAVCAVLSVAVFTAARVKFNSRFYHQTEIFLVETWRDLGFVDRNIN